MANTTANATEPLPPDPRELAEQSRRKAPPRTIPITGLVLAGGRGARMGYVDKGLQPMRGKPMVEYALERLAPQVDGMIVNTNQNLATYAAYGYPVVSDLEANFAGPLAGIEAGMSQCKTPYIVTVPCDVPFFPADFVAWMAQDLLRQDADIAFAVTGYGAQRESHPVFALMKCELLPDLSNFLRKDGHKMLAWFATKNMTRTFFDDEAAFRNFNTLDELRMMGD